MMLIAFLVLTSAGIFAAHLLEALDGGPPGSLLWVISRRSMAKPGSVR
jgi:hypothetical protein